MSTSLESNAGRTQGAEAAFIRNVHHELRTPLSVVQGYTQLLAQGGLGELNAEQADVLGIMDQRLAQLRIIVERIEILVEAEAHTLAAGPLVPLDLIAPSMARHQAAAEQAQLQFALVTAPDLPLIHGDQRALAQACDCLIENAIRFTPAGGQVQVRLMAEPGWVRFEVCDTGIGIPPEHLPHVLNGFCQADSGDNRRYNGLGLGLAVVRAVVQQHDGALDVKSDVGRGSQFTLRLPGAMTRPAVKPALLADPSAAEKRSAARPRRILLVDDELNQVRVLKSGLAKLPNCEITIATSGQEALNLFAHQTFDLMITDYRMPEMNGLQLAQEVRQRYPLAHIVMLTAFGHEVLDDHTGPNPVQQVLEKPIDIRHVRSVAQTALGKTNEET